MKGSCFLILFVVFFHSGFHAQTTNEQNSLKSRFRPGLMWFYTGFRPAQPEKLRKYDRLIFDLTYNTWNGDRKPFSNHWGSIGLNTNIMFDLPLAKKNLVSLGVGFCHSFVRIRHDESLLRDSIGSFSTLNELQANALPGKRILTGSTLAVPIELRFRSAGWKHMKIHIGGKIGYQFPWRSKIVTNPQSNRNVEKTHPYPDVNHLVYSIHARIGIRNWALYASYNLNTIFTKQQSAQLNVFQLGLSISLF